MGRVNLNDLDKYNSGSNDNKVKWLRLTDDKDTVQVRIMLEDVEDLNDYIYVTHKVTVGAKAKFPNVHINCLREYKDPVEKCPFCESGIAASVRVFLPVYNIEEDEVMFFDRPRSIIGKIQGLMGRYKDFPSHIFEIERNGEAGDKGTTYEFYEVDDDDVTLDDLPEIPQVLGSAVLDKTFDDMEYFVQEGAFPSTSEDKPVKRRASSKRRQDEDEDTEEEDVPFKEDEEEEKPRRSESRRPTKERSSRRVRNEDVY